MGKIAELMQVFDPPKEIIDAGLNGELVLFVGAGVSMLLDFPSWDKLAEEALKELREKEYLNFSEFQQLNGLGAKRKLSVAFQIAQDNKYSLDLTKIFPEISEGDSIYKSINDIGCPCVTTNYDQLLTPRFTEEKDGSTKPPKTHRIFEKEKFFTKYLDEPGTVIHLHGAIKEAHTMIVTTQQYLELYDHENVQVFLRELFNTKTVLFIGYGLEEAEILEHILRRSSFKPSPDKRHFALQGYFRSQNPLYEKLYNYYKQTFGIQLLGFIRDFKDYKQLEDILRLWVPQIKIVKPSIADKVAKMNKVLGL